ncbi:NUDIX domain-containing protein [Acetobacteraceae bacterium ESL0709]|nr:NUDIX domain-containing protein [Acetobacteraceae bacterium ESL0697]MDF7678342.1 NUDIX domain-containing protein [Acetobacteraceae bacterium ESL0709]
MPHKLSEQAQPFLRHIMRCHNARLPGTRWPLYIAHDVIGYCDPAFLKLLSDQDFASLLSIKEHSVTLKDGSVFLTISNALKQKNLYLPFHELFDVRTPEGRVIGQVDRALIPLFGLEAQGVHMNGLVRKQKELFLWVARRSPHKRLDPGKLDHIVAGGMSSGLTPEETIQKEAGEEASVPPALSAQAQKVSTIRYAMDRPEGLRRDLLHCFDLYLPEDFIPLAADGEVESFQLCPLPQVFETVRDSDSFKFNVNLVLIDLFLRHKFFQPEDETLLRDAMDNSAP